MKNYPHIISKVLREPWVITQERHESIISLLFDRISGGIEFSPAGSPDDEEYDTPYKDGAAYVIPVHGIIGKHLSSLEMMCGGCDLDTINAAISKAKKDPSIDVVAFDFNTPGGTVAGVPEIADKIAELSDVKQTVAFTDYQMCSAGYWMASQCNIVACSPSSSVGSIGVRMAFLDMSRQMEMEGVKINSFQGGKYKTMGAYWRTPTEEETKMFQAGVDKIYSQFKSAVLLKRDLADSVMQGQCFDGDECEENGLADAIVSDLDDAIELARR